MKADERFKTRSDEGTEQLCATWPSISDYAKEYCQATQTHARNMMQRIEDSLINIAIFGSLAKKRSKKLSRTHNS